MAFLNCFSANFKDVGIYNYAIIEKNNEPYND